MPNQSDPAIPKQNDAQQRVSTGAVSDLSDQDLIAQIVGHPTDVRAVPVPRKRARDPILSLEDISGTRLRDVSLDLYSGEILGIAGLLGSGRSELARIATGAQRPTSGQLHLRRRAVNFRDPAAAIASGVVLVPEDRRRHGAIMSMTLKENITLPALKSFARAGRIVAGREHAEAATLIERFKISPRHPGAPFWTLSGGNQQKAIVAKWLNLEPAVAVFDEPGQGVDVGSKEEIHRLLRQAADRRCALMVVDSDLDDLAALCDRVIVLRDGAVAVELRGDQLTRKQMLETALTAEEVAA